MAEPVTKLPVKKADKAQTVTASAARGWRPYDFLRQEIDRLFDDFDGDLWRTPFRSSISAAGPAWSKAMTSLPAVDAAEKDKSFEITAELPGLKESDIELSVANGVLTIKGEKKEEKEEKQKDYYLSERHYGSFSRSFGIPEAVDADKIEANFKNGVLTVTLPKTAEAQKSEKKIAIKAA